MEPPASLPVSGLDSHSLLKLMQLVSPILPIGSYAYSQGLEYAISEKWVLDESSTKEWISGLMASSLTQLDVPVFSRLYSSWKQGSMKQVRYWNGYLLASRESKELLEEDQHLGQALARLMKDLDFEEAKNWDGPASLLTLFSLAAVRWAIPLQQAAAGFLWMWAENQIVCAVKFVPLGQTAGQKLLLDLGNEIPALVEKGLKLQEDEIGFMAPGQVMASMLHETQYSRLFRS